MNKINPVKYTLVVLLTLFGVYANADDYKMGGKTYQDLVESSKKNTEELKKPTRLNWEKIRKPLLATLLIFQNPIQTPRALLIPKNTMR